MDVSNHLLKDADDPRADDTELRLKVEAAITREHGELFGMYPNPHEFNDLVRIRMSKVMAMALNSKNSNHPPVGCHPTDEELAAAMNLLCEPANTSEHGGLGGEVDAILKQRQDQWGDAYKQIAGDWNELLGTKLTNEDFIAMMIVLKLR